MSFPGSRAKDATIQELNRRTKIVSSSSKKDFKKSRTAHRQKVVFFSSITSDIAIELAKRYAQEGYIIAGFYRSSKLLHKLTSLPESHLFPFDLKNIRSIEKATKKFSELGLHWETFISCASQADPLMGFFESDFDEWSVSVHVNAIEQLRVLHYLYPFRDKGVVANVVFMAGPGTNTAPKNFSALTVAKIMLIKMCELLDIENEDLNVFTVGPGWTKTKAHELVLSDPHVSKEKYEETLNFMKNRQGTSMDDIYKCIRWLSQQKRSVVGGRNISVVHDYWGIEELANELAKDKNMYTLRRYRNDWKDKGNPRL